MRLLPLFAAVLLLLIVLVSLPRGVQGVSAAEVLNAATLGQNLSGTGDLIYDRLRLDWDSAGRRAENVTGEMWYTPGTRQYRYQLTSASGELLSYQAFDGKYTTQSVQVQPVGEVALEQVYRFKGYVPLGLKHPGDGGLLANPSPVSFWALAVHQAQQNKDDCTDLFCLLGLPQDGWDCQGSRCKYNFGDDGGMGNMSLELVLWGMARLEDGRKVYEIRLLPAGSLLQFLTGFGTVYVDVQTRQIVKVAYSMKMILRFIKSEMSLLHQERQWLDSASLGDDFYATAPSGIAVIPWEGDVQRFIQSSYGNRTNMAWIISADPPSGTQVSGEVTFNLEIGYKLTSLPYANLGVRLWGVGKDTGTKGSSKLVQAGKGVVQMSFTLDTDSLESGAWAAGAGFGIYVDAGSYLATTGLPLFDIQWCVRCEPALLPTQPAVLVTYWRPQIQVVTTGQVAEGYQLQGTSVSPTHLLLHRPGHYDEADLPQIVETQLLDLSGLTQTTIIPLELIIPDNTEVIGTPVVQVRVEILKK